MSHEATNWAIKQRGLRPIAKLVLWHLADCHNPSMGCFPTQDYLADSAEISRASVNRILAELEAAGLIRREQQIDEATKRQRPTRYRLAFEDGFDALDVVPRVSSCDTEKSSEPCLKNGDSRVSKSTEAVSHSYETLTSNRTSNGTGNARARSDGFVALQSVLDPLNAKRWADHLRDKRKPLTSATAEMQAGVLRRIRETGVSPAKAIDFAINRGWASLEYDYFVNAGLVQAKPAARDADYGLGGNTWEEWCEAWFTDRIWKHVLGPEPGAPGCRAPTEIVERFRAKAKDAA